MRAIAESRRNVELISLLTDELDPAVHCARGRAIQLNIVYTIRRRPAEDKPG